MMLFEKERYLRKNIGDEWRESEDKRRQAFLALLNSELPSAIPTWSSVNLINTDCHGGPYLFP